jgi:hypothetical protein
LKFCPSIETDADHLRAELPEEIVELLNSKSAEKKVSIKPSKPEVEFVEEF